MDVVSVVPDRHRARELADIGRLFLFPATGRVALPYLWLLDALELYKHATALDRGERSTVGSKVVLYRDRFLLLRLSEHRPQ